jgi:hypothetical protein
MTERRAFVSGFRPDQSPSGSDPWSLIAARQQTHGNFTSTAWVAQTLRDVFRHELGWERLSIVQREVLDAMAVKIAREYSEMRGRIVTIASPSCPPACKEHDCIKRRAKLAKPAL